MTIQTTVRIRVRRIALALATPLLLAAGVGLVGPSANAASAATPYLSWISSNSGGANLRTCASTSCGTNPYLPYLGNGTNLYMLCWYDYGGATGNYYSTRWFYVGFPYSNHTGWVHSSLVTHQNPSAPHCSGPSGWS
jgi:hypothetical protein